MQDAAMCSSETNVDAGMSLNAEKSVHRHEINTLVKQLLGNDRVKTHNETILLDLFENNRRK